MLAAAAFALVAMADPIATARRSSEDELRRDANRELAGRSGANVASSLVDAFPVSAQRSDPLSPTPSGRSGRMSRTAPSSFHRAVRDRADRAAAEGCTRRVIVARGADARRPAGRLALRQDRTAEAALSVAATAGVLVFGPLRGVALAIAFSIGASRTGWQDRTTPVLGRSTTSTLPRPRAVAGRRAHAVSSCTGSTRHSSSRTPSISDGVSCELVNTTDRPSPR